MTSVLIAYAKDSASRLAVRKHEAYALQGESKIGGWQ